MSVPFARPDIGSAEVDAVTQALSSGWLTGGKKVAEFEEKFAAYVGAKEAVAVNSATSAALLLFDALWKDKGSEIIVPTYTYSSPAMMAQRLGLKVVLADCAPGSRQVDVKDVLRKISDRTRFIMPTHFAGEACDLRELAAVCKDEGIDLLEDAAHALPTLDVTSGSLVGSCLHSTATFFSFYATKTITTGDGGMITTNDQKLATRLRQLRSNGVSSPAWDRYTRVGAPWHYNVALPGWKVNMTDIEAALGMVQLDRADEMRRKRYNISRWYLAMLSNIRGIKLPVLGPDHAAHLYTIEVPENLRDKFIEKMGERGAQCSVHFIPLHMHTYWNYRLGYEEKDLPNATSIYRRTVSLPLFSSMTEEQLIEVIDAVQATSEELGLC